MLCPSLALTQGFIQRRRLVGIYSVKLKMNEKKVNIKVLVFAMVSYFMSKDDFNFLRRVKATTKQ